MSFLFKYTHKTYVIKRRNQKRKEKDSLLAQLPTNQFISQIERASSFTSKASITVEAAMAVPFFFFAVLCLVCLLEMMVTQTVVKSAFHYCAKEMAEEAYMNPFVIPGQLEENVAKVIGDERLNRSMISGGAAGIDCSRSKAWGKTGIMDLVLEYRMEVPIFTFRIPVISKKETLRIKGWNGYAGNGFGNQDDETVYITETGIVYHKDADCTYLELSIKAVPKGEIKDLRNSSGGKYYPCEACRRKNGGKQYVYITETGDRYHKSLGCSGLKRTVYAVPLSEVYGRGGCSRCVK